MERNATKLIQRAWSAYQTSDGADAEQPVERCSGEYVIGGLHYIALRSERRLVAVYRYRRSIRKLRRMKRWPLELGRETSTRARRSPSVNAPSSSFEASK
jgi:hypothetical protein